MGAIGTTSHEVRSVSYFVLSMLARNSLLSDQMLFLPPLIPFLTYTIATYFAFFWFRLAGVHYEKGSVNSFSPT
jgi:hypothetical protein